MNSCTISILLVYWEIMKLMLFYDILGNDNPCAGDHFILNPVL